MTAAPTKPCLIALAEQKRVQRYAERDSGKYQPVRHDPSQTKILSEVGTLVS